MSYKQDKKKTFKVRDYERIPAFLEKIKELWLFHPDLRFGQLFSILESKLKEKYECDPFYIEDDKWLEIIDMLIDEARNNK